MPPKPVLTKEKIIDTAFEIVRDEGFEALTSRSIANRLKCSTQPIYSLYANMDEIQNITYNQAINYAQLRMKEYKDSNNSPALNLAIGFLYFAKNEKHLFRTIYLSGHKKYDPQTEKFLGEELSIAYMQYSKRLSNISSDRLKKIFLNLAIYLIGIGTLINTDTMELDISEATDMLTEMYEMLLLTLQ